MSASSACAGLCARSSGLRRALRLAAVLTGLSATWGLAPLGAPPTAPLPAAASAERPPRPDANAWVLVDAADGERVAGHSISSERAIASTTKLMTAYVALRELPLDRVLAAPDYQPVSPLESLAGLAPGERMSVRDLLYALLLPSANDAAVTLAEGASGSVPRFVREMNRTAAALGLTGTHYENPIGLDSARNYSTAADLASLTRRLRKRPILRRIFDTPSAALRTGNRTRRVISRNSLLMRVPWVNGVKTGRTQQAGDVLVGSGTRKGATLISVVLGAPGEAARDRGTLDLLDYGFSLYRRETAVRDGEAVASPDLEYQGTTLPLVARRNLRVSVRRGQQVEKSVSAPGDVEGPIERGEKLGEVTATVDGRKAGAVPLVAARAADRASFLEQARGRLPGPVALVGIGAVILIGVVAASRAANRRRRGPEQRMQNEEPMQRTEHELGGGTGERP